jgi:hypothetical protein
MGRFDDLHDCSSDLRGVCILRFEGSQPFQDNVGYGCRGTLGILLGAPLIGGRAGVQEVVGTFGEGAWHNVCVLPKWQARELAVNVVYPAQRRLPLRVRTFIDFSVNYMSTVLKPGKR